MHSDMVVEATLVSVNPKPAGKLELNGFRVIAYQELNDQT